MPLPQPPHPATAGMSAGWEERAVLSVVFNTLTEMRCFKHAVLDTSRRWEVRQGGFGASFLYTGIWASRSPVLHWSQVTAAHRAAVACDELFPFPRGNSSSAEDRRVYPQEPFPWRCCVGRRWWLRSGVWMFSAREGWPWGSGACCFPEPSLQSALVNSRVNPYVTYLPIFSFLKYPHSQEIIQVFVNVILMGPLERQGLPHRTKNKKCWNSYLAMEKTP